MLVEEYAEPRSLLRAAGCIGWISVDATRHRQRKLLKKQTEKSLAAPSCAEVGKVHPAFEVRSRTSPSRVKGI